MADFSDSDRAIITANPLASSLDTLRPLLRNAEQAYERSLMSFDGAVDLPTQLCQRATSQLLIALSTNDAAFELGSPGGQDMAQTLTALRKLVVKGQFDYTLYRTLSQLIIRRASDMEIWEAARNLAVYTLPSTPPRPTRPPFDKTPVTRNMSSLVNTSEARESTDPIILEDLGLILFDIPEFYDTFFGQIDGLGDLVDAVLARCMQGETPLFDEEDGWRGWPQSADEPAVIAWLQQTIERLETLARASSATFYSPYAMFSSPHNPLKGSVAKRSLDIGFVEKDKPRRGGLWKNILVPGELKKDPAEDKAAGVGLHLARYAREVLALQDTRRFVLGFTICGTLMRLWEFDRSGAIASESFDIHDSKEKFIGAILGFLLLNKEQLGHDMTIIGDGLERYIEIQRNGQTERLIIEGQIIRRARCIAGRATTCWKAYSEASPETPLVIKDSWQFLERDSEGELLREATNAGVINVARYYFHETIQIDGADDDTYNSIRKGLSATGRLDRLAPEVIEVESLTLEHSSQNVSSGLRRKRSSSRALAPPSKRKQSNSPARQPVANRVHRRVIVQDYGKPLHKASSLIAFLEGLIGCIDGYQSLYEKAGIIQSDISLNNLMINEDENNPSFDAFLIDLDLAVKEQRDGPSGAQGKTGTRAFMSIGVLLGHPHSFMHDLESFFWVFLWICVHYDKSGNGKTFEQYESWNYMGTTVLAAMKSGLIGEDFFLVNVIKDISPHYMPLAPWLNRLRRVVFPGGKAWTQPDRTLFSRMKQVLRTAQTDPKVVDERLVEDFDEEDDQEPPC